MQRPVESLFRLLGGIFDGIFEAATLCAIDFGFSEFYHACKDEEK